MATHATSASLGSLGFGIKDVGRGFKKGAEATGKFLKKHGGDVLEVGGLTCKTLSPLVAEDPASAAVAVKVCGGIAKVGAKINELQGKRRAGTITPREEEILRRLEAMEEAAKKEEKQRKQLLMLAVAGGGAMMLLMMAVVVRSSR